MVDDFLLASKEGWITLQRLMSQKRIAFERDEDSENYVSMEGKTVVITGGTSGVGLATATELAKRRARVIVGCRDVVKGREDTTGVYLVADQHVTVRCLDLSSFASVWNFAEEVLSTETRLDVLINAAAMVPDYSLKEFTTDDNERSIQTNYIGHVLLTTFLLELLQKSAPSRIVNVSCGGHQLGSIDGILGLLLRDGREYMHPGLAYYDSKLALVFFTELLARDLRDSGVTVNTADPGVLKDGACVRYPGVQGGLIECLRRRYGKTAAEGAQTCVYLAMDPSVANETGNYYLDGKRQKPAIEGPVPPCIEGIYELTLRLSNAQEATKLLPK
ncbi:retinol dehydrogenase 12-like [Amblyomma americanum]